MTVRFVRTWEEIIFVFAIPFVIWSSCPRCYGDVWGLYYSRRLVFLHVEWFTNGPWEICPKIGYEILKKLRDAASGIRTHDLQMSQILAPHMLVKPYESGALTKLGYRSSHNVHNKNAG